MSENPKTNKPVNPPVIISVKRIPTGYQLIADKGANTISLTKSMLTKTGKSASKGSVSKTTSKGAESTPNTAQKNANMSKSKSSIKPPAAGGTKSAAPAQSQVSTREKAPAMAQEVEVKRREIFPFTDFTMEADGSLDIPENNIPIDLTVSMELTKAEKPLDSMMGQAANNLKPGEKIKKMSPLVVPSSAHWFKFEEIHLIERAELPEFFMGKPSKSPEIYKKYRNFIINLYRQNPKLYLNSTKCRKSLGGDACAIMKIHEFLERWGLINFSVNPKRMQNLNMSKPDKIGDKILVFSKTEDKFDMFNQERNLAQKRGENDDLFNQIRILTKKYRPLCDYCGMICGLVWYQQKSPAQYQELALADLNKAAATSTSAENPSLNPNTNANPNPGSTPVQAAAPIVISSSRKKELILCIKCFTDGNIPNILSHSDFVKIDVLSKLDSSVDNTQTAVWTEEENLLLLELIEKHADDWEEIQKVMKHRSHEEIIMHYLQLPLNNVTSMNISEAREDEDEQPDTAKKELESLHPSFSEYANPILQHVAIFGSLLEKFRPRNRGEQVKNEQESSTKEKMETEIVGVKDEEKSSTMEIEGKKSTSKSLERMEEEKKSLRKERGDLSENDKSLVINDAEFDFDKIEQERATYGRERLHDDRYGDGLSNVDQNARNQAERVRRREGDRLVKATNALVDLQINKLEMKLNFFDEYEKIMWQERRHQEVFQKVMIAERVALAHKKMELMKQEQLHHQNLEEHKDPTTMLNFNSQPSNMNVDDMISLGNNDKADEYPKDAF